MREKWGILQIAITLLILIGCAPPAPSLSRPTDPTAHLPTGTAMRATTSPAPSPTASDPLTSAFPRAAIEILSPIKAGSYSSPLLVSLKINESPRSPLNISLHGSDGRLLVRRIILLDDEHAEINLPFAIGEESERARLSVSWQDEMGRPIALSSLPITLRSSADENAPEDPQLLAFPSEIEIQSPLSGQQLTPGILEVTARLQEMPALPVFIQLVSNTGKVLHFAEVYAQAAEAQPFPIISTEFDLQLDEAQYLLLSITLRDPLIPGPQFILTQPFFFSP